MPATGPRHEADCRCDRYACRLRSKGVQISPEATPSRHNRKAPRTHTGNSWEKGIAGEHRPGGTFMPYLDKGDVIPIKKYTENRHTYEDRKAQVRHTARQLGDTH